MHDALTPTVERLREVARHHGIALDAERAAELLPRAASLLARLAALAADLPVAAPPAPGPVHARPPAP